MLVNKVLVKGQNSAFFHVFTKVCISRVDFDCSDEPSF
jgi:hypothetical protein